MYFILVIVKIDYIRINLLSIVLFQSTKENTDNMSGSTRHINMDRVYGGGKKGNIWEDILKLSAENGALNLALGFPDFAPPSHVVKALGHVTSYANHMIHHYTRAAVC